VGKGEESGQGMTTQTKKFIDLNDIIGLRVRCKNVKCNASLLLDASKLAEIAQENNTTLVQCPACHSSWTVPPRDPNGYPGASNMGYDKEVKQLLTLLTNFRSFQTKLGCEITFEIANDSLELPS